MMMKGKRHARTAMIAKPVTVKLDGILRERIKNLAEVRHRTMHWVMREAIVQYVEQEEKREACRQDTLRAWEDYQQTGMHLTGQEVDDWMAKLEGGDDAELPVCHR